MTFALFLPTFLLNWSGLNQAWIFAIWLGLAVIDPWLEEGYWRGVLRDATSSWPAWLSISYAVVFFAPSHYLLLGPSVTALNGPQGIIGTLFTGLLWTISAYKSRSLRRPILSHFIADRLTVSPLIFLNRATLPG